MYALFLVPFRNIWGKNQGIKISKDINYLRFIFINILPDIISIHNLPVGDKTLIKTISLFSNLLTGLKKV